jgi:glycosyltransferase involved in cell wall biosynthesis
MHVIQTTGGLGERYGGPPRSITGLSTGLGRCGVDVSLVAGFVARIDGLLVRPDTKFVTLTLVDAWQFGPVRLYPGFRGVVRRLAGTHAGDVLIHDHGMWAHSNFSAWQASRDAKVPYVLSPRGMISPWALGHKGWKKRIALPLYQRRILEDAAMLVATAESEYESIREFGLKQPVAIIPNGIDPVESVSPVTRVDRAEGNRRRTALFLSRIQAKKGLLNLLHAWAQITAPDWCLKIAGPDEGGHLQEVRLTIERLGLSGSVEYVGASSGESKSRLYSSSDLFVLPTFTENFGLVVAEALAHGLPVITTKGAPWRDLEVHRCGWWIDIGVEPLVAALREAFALPDVERQSMGVRGREYVRRYDWKDIASRMADVYRWVLGGADRPASVRMD